MKPIEKLNRLIEFMNIPVIDKTLSVKIREWERFFEPEINEFRSLKKRFDLITGELFSHESFKMLREYKNIHALRFIKAPGPGKQLKDSWTLESIRPPMEENQLAGLFQSDEFLQLLEESPEAPKSLKTIIESRDNNGKPAAKYRIWLKKVAVNVVTGMICSHNNNDGHFPFFLQDTGDSITSKKQVEQMIQDYMYFELFRFMEDNPEAKDQIFFYFRNVLKPNALLKEKMPEV